MGISYNSLFLGQKGCCRDYAVRELACAVWEHSDNKMLPKFFFECNWKTRHPPKTEVQIGQLDSVDFSFYFHQHEHRLFAKDSNGQVITEIQIKRKFSFTHAVDLLVYDGENIHFATIEIRGKLSNKTEFRFLLPDAQAVLLYVDKGYSKKLIRNGVALELYSQRDLRDWLYKDRLPSTMGSKLLRFFNFYFSRQARSNFFERKPTCNLPPLLKNELRIDGMTENRKISMLIAVLFSKVFDC